MTALERTADWHQANQRVLAAGINAVRQVLDLVAHDPADPSASGLVDAALGEAEARMPSPSSLSELVSRFGLTSFERDLVLLCAGMELDPAVTAAWQQATGMPGAVLPSFGLALEVLPSAHWSAMTPGSVLRRARLLALGQGPTLGTRPLRIEEPVLHFLNGLPELDARLDGVVTSHRDRLPRATFQQMAARRIVAKLGATRNAGGAWPVVTLRTSDRVAALAVAAQAAAGIGAELSRLSPEALPADRQAAADLVDLWDRDSVLLNSALFVDMTGESDPQRHRSVVRALNRQRGLLFLASSMDDRGLTRPTFRVELRRLTPVDRRSLWQGFLGDAAVSTRAVDAVAEAYPFDATTIAEVAEEIRYSTDLEADGGLAAVQAQGRERMRALMEPIAQRMEVAADWKDVVLPPLQLEMLQSMAAQIRNRPRISRLWAPRSTPDEGPAALFLGERGTGKTLAAAAIAGQLRRDLYRIDAADFLGSGGRGVGRRFADVLKTVAGAEIVLLVDLPEDALLDRGDEGAELYLARARGLIARAGAMPVIFESREGGAVPQSFLRDMRFVVRFPHPSADLRREIWRRALPEAVEREAIDEEKLARLPLAGGSIQTIAYEAALRAAEEGGPVTMAHLERAARVEYAKLGRTLSPIETRGWAAPATARQGGEKGEKR